MNEWKEKKKTKKTEAKLINFNEWIKFYWWNFGFIFYCMTLKSITINLPGTTMSASGIKGSRTGITFPEKVSTHFLFFKSVLRRKKKVRNNLSKAEFSFQQNKLTL